MALRSSLATGPELDGKQLRCYTGKAAKDGMGGGHHAVWHHNIEQGEHPTQKPLGLVREWIHLFSDPGETILDPFMGNGTTLRAAKDMGRKAIGIELDERWAEASANRLRQEVLFT
jgi:site-specific DNA-methyltransferase (adenine-specific)